MRNDNAEIGIGDIETDEKSCMPTPSTTAGTTIGRRKSVRIGPERKSPRVRRPSAAIVPRTVASAMVPKPIIRLLTIARRHTSAVVNSSNQRTDQPGTG